jgi:hypothetical protein
LASPKIRSFTPTTSFRFHAYRELKRTLGEINAVVETTELAMRSFVAQAKLAADTDTFIKNLSILHGVRVDKLDLQVLTRQMNHFYIVSVHQHFETFLKSFKKEHPRTVWESVDNDPLLKDVLSSFSPRTYKDMLEAMGRLETDLADYYRNVRNAVAHGDDKNTLQRTYDLRSRVQHAERHTQSFRHPIHTIRRSSMTSFFSPV